jgi:hypothetical protein
MLIKGAALSHVLGKSYQLTVARDADVLVRPVDGPGRIDSGETRRVIDAYHRIRKHTLFEIDNYVHHDINMNGILPISFYDIWCRANRMSINGHEFRLPDYEDMLMISCINVVRKKFMVLRHLLDIAELINENDRIGWDEVARRATVYRCSHIVYSAVLVAESVLGCDVDKAALGTLRPRTPRATAIAFTLHHISS